MKARTFPRQTAAQLKTKHLPRAGGALLCLVSILFVPYAGIPASARAAEPEAKPESPAPAKKAKENDNLPSVDFVMTHNIGSEHGEFKEERAWKESPFAGKGEISVEGDTVILGMGNDMTGITWRGPLVNMNYEVTLEAKRVEGNDFFCGLTFPFGDRPCSLIVGGWGGTCCGISCLDFQDAYNNETARFRTFKYDTWYPIKLRVTPDRIEAWIEDEKLVDVSTKGRYVDIRPEVEESRPFGIATWRTTGAIRNVKLRALGEKGGE